MSDSRIRIGISACLLGQEVRFDGGHKRDSFLTDILGPHVEWVPVCPEVEVGMGTPREPVRLVRPQRAGSGLLMITMRTNVDYTDRMNDWAVSRVEELAGENLSGYVLKKDSPSCGLERVTVYPPNGMPERTGRGLFATALKKRFASLPIEEEGRLSDPRLRENFIERVFAYRRLTDLFTGHWKTGALVRFHTSHKMALLAHSTTAYNELGRMVARAKAMGRHDLRERYQRLFMETLAQMATTRKHTNVLSHMAGHLKGLLDEGVPLLDERSRRELHHSIDEYRRGLVPLVVPLTLIRHHVRVHDVAYLAGQTYLDPHPCELMLRNHV